jgi:hypothetical protein
LPYNRQLFADQKPHRYKPNERHTVRMEFNGTPRTDAFTQRCRDVIRSLTFEAILACTVYGAPMLFMIGPAAIVVNHPLIIIVLHSVLGFGMGWTIHRMGHRLLSVLPKDPKTIYLSPSLRLPKKLTLSQFIWMLEILVAAGVCCGVAGKRVMGTDLIAGLLLCGFGFVFYFIPVYITKLWRERYYPALSLFGPSEAMINKSFPSLRSLLP